LLDGGHGGSEDSCIGVARLAAHRHMGWSVASTAFSFVFAVVIDVYCLVLDYFCYFVIFDQPASQPAGQPASQPGSQPAGGGRKNSRDRQFVVFLF